MTFDSALKKGKLAEGWIAKWLIARGHHVMPAYEIEVSEFKGPQLFTPDGEFVSPDLLVFKANGIVWVEAKHKSVFSWYRKGQRWTTGIDYHHYTHYKMVGEKTGLPVYLAFFHREKTPNVIDQIHDCPAECPTGLFIGDITYLSKTESHRSPPKSSSRAGLVGHGRHGMVYWADTALTKVATCREVYEITETP